MRLSDQPVSPLEVLYCVSCDQTYSAIDLALFRFDWETMSCSFCQEDLFSAPLKRSCFGKRFEPAIPECSHLCPDRKLCPDWQKGIMQKKIGLTQEMRQAAVKLYRKEQFEKAKSRRISRELPFQRGSITLVIWEMARKGTTVDKIRELCVQIGADPTYYFRILRKGFANGHRWKYEEDGQVVLIRYEGKA